MKDKFIETYMKIIAEANETPVPEKLYKWEITFRMKDENGEFKGGNKRTVIAPTQICAILKFQDLFTDEENSKIDPKGFMVNKGLASKEEAAGWTWPKHQIENKKGEQVDEIASIDANENDINALNGNTINLSLF